MEPAVPTNALGDEDRRHPHTHPVPIALRRALVFFGVGLAATLLLAGYAVVRLQTIVRAQGVDAYLSCVQRLDTAKQNLTRYDALLAPLAQAQDPALVAVRGLMTLQRDAAFKNVGAIKCGPDPR